MKTPVHIQSGHIPFLRLVLFYVLGILIGYLIVWSPEKIRLIYQVLLASFAFALLLFFIKNRIKKPLYITFLYLTLTVFGCYQFGSFVPTARTDFPINPNHKQYIGTIDDEPQIRKNTIRFPLKVTASVDTVGTQAISALVMVSIQKDSLTIIPQYGDVIQFQASLREISPPQNPNEFDYKKYLKNKGILYQVYIKKSDFHIIDHQRRWFSYVIHSRQYFVEKFRTFINHDKAFQIAAALVFGYRSEMDPETLSAFTNTGTIHVLSVSGMHVSMVFALLMFLLKPIDRVKHGKHIRFTSILTVIWLYVILTGMAPPILRAGIMISFFILAQWLEKQQTSVNILLSSGFVLLVFNPAMLFDVGFQLSYLAMFGIFLLYPIFRSWWLPPNKWLKLIVAYCYISIAAQWATAPLTIYYFDQFPNYFLLANLVIAIPATIIMYAGLLLLFFPLGWLGKLLGAIEELTIKVMYQSLVWIEALPFAIIQGIAFSTLQVLLMFIGICSFFYGFNYQKKAGLFALMTSTIILIAQHQWTNIQTYRERTFVIFNVRGQIAISYSNEGKAVLFSTLDSSNHATLNYTVWPSLKKHSKTENLKFVPLSDTTNQLLKVGDRELLIWNNEHKLPNTEGKYILLRNNRRLSEASLSPAKYFILDGSNYGRILEQNLALLQEENQEFYLLKDNFAYVW